MDILSGSGAVDEFQRAFTEAAELEASEWTPSEFRQQTQLNAFQEAFAKRFADCAPSAWADLCFMEPIAIQWMAARFKSSTGESNIEASIEAAKLDRLLHFGILAWARKYGVDTPWLHVMALATLRGLAFTKPFDYPQPTTLLHNEFPSMEVVDGMVELGTSRLSVTPWSSIIVCADQGIQEWRTLDESKAQFRKRVLEAFTKELDAQLSRVENPLLSADIDVKWHWVDWTIQRYAGHRSIRAVATSNNVSRPAVTKAIEAIRLILGLEKLPETWGETPPAKW